MLDGQRSQSFDGCTQQPKGTGIERPNPASRNVKRFIDVRMSIN